VASARPCPGPSGVFRSVVLHWGGERQCHLHDGWRGTPIDHPGRLPDPPREPAGAAQDRARPTCHAVRRRFSCARPDLEFPPRQVKSSRLNPATPKWFSPFGRRHQPRTEGWWFERGSATTQATVVALPPATLFDARGIGRPSRTSTTDTPACYPATVSYRPSKLMVWFRGSWDS
jgi:hypothetical protein